VAYRSSAKTVGTKALKYTHKSGGRRGSDKDEPTPTRMGRSRHKKSTRSCRKPKPGKKWIPQGGGARTRRHTPSKEKDLAQSATKRVLNGIRTTRQTVGSMPGRTKVTLGRGGKEKLVHEKKNGIRLWSIQRGAKGKEQRALNRTQTRPISTRTVKAIDSGTRSGENVVIKKRGGGGRARVTARGAGNSKKKTAL